MKINKTQTNAAQVEYANRMMYPPNALFNSA